MENIERIAEAFKEEKDIVLICSDVLKSKLDKELTDINASNLKTGYFKNGNNELRLEFTSVYFNGVSIHYTNNHNIILNEKNRSKVKNPLGIKKFKIFNVLGKKNEEVHIELNNGNKYIGETILVKQ